jgi:hypothetical protein
MQTRDSEKQSAEGEEKRNLELENIVGIANRTPIIICMLNFISI